MNLKLTAAQATELGALLDAELGDLSYEIVATDNPHYREGLRARRDLLAAAREQLRIAALEVPEREGPTAPLELEKELAHPGG